MKTEILQAIRNAEEEYQAEIAKGKAEKERRIAAATLEADGLVMKARTGTEEYKKQRLEEARREAGRKRDTIMREGERQAALLREQAGKNLDGAVRLLLKRFESEVYVKD
ncbi:MAG TPA: ATPase [Methanomicrobiales archaeon]|jgi:V/A-type H+-transporting ATPase subunit G/H|nr:ATPase [Methanomicrobiales archaeon]